MVSPCLHAVLGDVAHEQVLAHGGAAEERAVAHRASGPTSQFPGYLEWRLPILEK
jgi:hypothetical protein